MALDNEKRTKLRKQMEKLDWHDSGAWFKFANFYDFYVCHCLKHFDWDWYGKKQKFWKIFIWNKKGHLCRSSFDFLDKKFLMPDSDRAGFNRTFFWKDTVFSLGRRRWKQFIIVEMHDQEKLFGWRFFYKKSFQTRNSLKTLFL